MPLVYQQNINLTTKLGVWHIIEQETFFLQKVQVQRNIHHPQKRLQHLAGRYLLQTLFPNFPHQLILVADTKKPFLVNDPFHFSISHCESYAAAIVSTDSRVGIDVEVFSTKPMLLVHKFLNDWEQQLFLNNTNTVSLPTLYTCAWSIKETLYKWYGAGSVDFKKHLHINTVVFNDNEGLANCTFLKEANIPIQVRFLLFNNNCISWLVH